jgi:hypothetical protein
MGLENQKKKNGRFLQIVLSEFIWLDEDNKRRRRRKIPSFLSITCFTARLSSSSKGLMSPDLLISLARILLGSSLCVTPTSPPCVSGD